MELRITAAELERLLDLADRGVIAYSARDREIDNRLREDDGDFVRGLSRRLLGKDVEELLQPKTEEVPSAPRPTDCEGAGFALFERDGREHCNYCGSITLEAAIGLLSTPGTHYSGSDWKYGYPHKFYIGAQKFYTRHTDGASDEQIARWNAAAEATVGVTFEKTENGIRWKSPCQGYQAAGVVGVERQEYGRPA